MTAIPTMRAVERLYPTASAPQHAFVPRPRPPADTITQPPYRLREGRYQNVEVSRYGLYDVAWLPSGPEVLRIHVSQRDGYTVVYFMGEVEILTTDVTSDLLNGLLTETDSRLILDLGGVTFMEACGLRPLYEAARRAADCGGWVRLANVASPFVQKILGLIRPKDQLSIYETVSAAADGRHPLELPALPPPSRARAYERQVFDCRA